MSSRTFNANKGGIWICLAQCAWCLRIKIAGRYRRLPRVPLLRWHCRLRLPFLPPLLLGVSHGACPACSQRVNDNARQWRLQQDPPTGQESAASD